MNEFEESMKQQAEMEKEMVAHAREEMKKELVSKTDCMIASYSKVLNNVATMFRNSKTGGLESSEVAQRADMFWNIALQRMDREEQEAKRVREQRQNEFEQAQRSGMPPMPQGQPMPPMPEAGRKTPCQERAERDAKIIEELKAKNDKVVEAEIVK